LKDIGLWGKYSYQKFIPDEWLNQSVEFRLELLRGLADTDGTCGKHRSGNSRTQYYSTSKKLADAFRWLVFSLGGTSTLRKREFDEDDFHLYKGRVIRHCHPVYVVDFSIKSFNPFGCERKASKYKTQSPVRLISSVEFVGEKECQCISVEASHHQYITDNFIVTHNTLRDAVCILDEAQNCTTKQIKLFLTRLGMNAKMIVTGDPSQSDLKNGCDGLMEIVEDLKDVEGIAIVEMKSNAIVRHPLVEKILAKLDKKQKSII
jgi:phosphate starvation-inducible protein PhoH and related proteins